MKGTMPTWINQMNTRKRIVTRTNHGGCISSVNNVLIIMELQYRVKKKFTFFCKEKYKWVTVYKTTDCVSRIGFDEKLLTLKHQLLKGYDKSKNHI